MNDDWFGFFVGVFLTTIVIAAAGSLISAANTPGAPQPISGRVIEKATAFTGHNNTVHILKIEQAEDRYTLIIVTAQVWNSTLVGVEYDFLTGDKGGYDSAVESVRE